MAYWQRPPPVYGHSYPPPGPLIQNGNYNHFTNNGNQSHHQNGYQNNNNHFNYHHHHQGRGGYHQRGRGGYVPSWRGARRGRGGRGGSGHGHPTPSVHQPWMTDDLLEAMKERKQAQQKALETKDPDDWRIFKAIRNRTAIMLNDAKLLYSEKQNALNGTAKEKSEFFCDTCDRSFPNDASFKSHIAEHVTCKLDGCNFTAHPKVLLKHIGMQHSGNLFARVKGYDSPAEIEKWKDERKMNYPTADNIDRKQKTKAEQIGRGERMPSQNHHNFRRRNEHRHVSQHRTERKPSNYQRNGASRSPRFKPSVLHNKSLESNNITTSCQMTDTERSHTDQPVCPNPILPNRKSYHGDQESNPGTTNVVITEPPSAAAAASSSPRPLQNLVVLENFFAQVRVGANGHLVGKKFMEWNIKCQNLCKSGTSCVGRTKLCSEGSAMEDEDSQDELLPTTCITDEEDAAAEIFPKVDDLSILQTPIPFIESSAKTDAHKSPECQPCTPKDISTSLLGLVAYSSDSDCDPPDEIPTVSIKEDGEVSEGDDSLAPVADLALQQDTSSLETNSSHPPQHSITTVDSVSQSTVNGYDEKWTPKKKEYIKRVQNRPVFKRKQPRMSRLLRMLIEPDIRRERNQILQVCRFICENNFFDDDSKPGSKESTME